MTITCSVWDRKLSKFADVKIFNPSGSFGSSLVSSLASFSAGTLSTSVSLEENLQTIQVYCDAKHCTG